MNVPETISLQLLAHVAASLLRGNNHADAARRAYKLLEACEAHLGLKARENAQRHQELLEQLEATKRNDDRRIPWKRAVKKITGKSDDAKAKAAFRVFFGQKVRTAEAKMHITPDESSVKSIIATMLASWKETGIGAGRVKQLRKEYQASLGSSRRKVQTQKHVRREHGRG